VTEVPLGNPLVVEQAVESGKVVAGTVFSPALEEGLASGASQVTFDFRQYPFASNIMMARTSEMQKSPALYQNFMDAYNAAVNKLESDSNFAIASAVKYYGQGVDASVLQSELNFYIQDEWKGTTFPVSLYNASASVLVNSPGSGFTNASMPSYAALTKDTSKISQPPKVVASRITGVAVPGRRVAMRVLGSNFSGTSKVTSNAAGTTVRVAKTSGSVLNLLVTTRVGTRKGVHLLTIRFANGQVAKIRYNVS